MKNEKTGVQSKFYDPEMEKIITIIGHTGTDELQIKLGSVSILVKSLNQYSRMSRCYAYFFEGKDAYDVWALTSFPKSKVYEWYAQYKAEFP